jgi:hypothetical protein
MIRHVHSCANCGAGAYAALVNGFRMIQNIPRYTGGGIPKILQGVVDDDGLCSDPTRPVPFCYNCEKNSYKHDAVRRTLPRDIYESGFCWTPDNGQGYWCDGLFDGFKRFAAAGACHICARGFFVGRSKPTQCNCCSSYSQLTPRKCVECGVEAPIKGTQLHQWIGSACRMKKICYCNRCGPNHHIPEIHRSWWLQQCVREETGAEVTAKNPFNGG